MNGTRKRTRAIPIGGLLAGALILVLAALMLTAPPSEAALVARGSFGSTGAGPGELSSPQRVAVQQSTNRIFVADRGNDRIQVFADDGDAVSFVTDFGVGVLDAPVGIAINQATGDVYVTDSGNGRIVVFNPDFTVASTFGSVGAGGGDAEFASLETGIAVDPTVGDVLVADPAGRVQRFAADGTFLASFDGSLGNPLGAFPSGEGTGPYGPSDVAVDAAGHVYVVAPSQGAFGGSGRVEKFDAAGNWLLALPIARPRGVVAVDPVGDDAFASNLSPLQVEEVLRFDSAGQQLEALAATPFSLFFDTNRSGLALGTNGHLYVAESGQDRVLVFGPPEPPVASTAAASEILQSSARLSGSVDANAAPATYHFEYGLDTNYGATVPMPDASAGMGADPVEVSEQIAGLDPGTTYHYRLVATSDGGTAVGADQTFDTLPELAPTVAADAASNVTQVAARLSGSVGPQGAATSYRFEYGLDTGYGSSIPVPDGDLAAGVDPAAVAHALVGLDPGTTYHFRLVATSPAGTTTGEDHVFTTSPELAPEVVTGAADEVTDEVATLRGSVDPNGAPTSYRFEYGLDTGYGSSAPVPDGDAGTGLSPVDVALDLLDLEAETTYHFRLVATSAAGVSEGEDRSFATGSNATPTAQRGFELVTPADDRQYDAAPAWPGSGVIAPRTASAQSSSADGRHVAFLLMQGGLLPGMAPDGESKDYAIASRDQNGWGTVVPLGDRSGIGCNPEGEQAHFADLSDDGEKLLESTPCPADKLRFSDGLDQTVPASAGTLYLFDKRSNTATFVGGKRGSGGLPAPRSADADNGDDYLGSAGDLSTIYFATGAGLLPGVPDAQGSEGYIYKRRGDVTTLATRAPNGDPLPFLGSEYDRPGGVSRDGETLTITARAQPMVAEDVNLVDDVYQIGDGQPLWISDPAQVASDHRPAPQPAADRFFEGASGDGSMVYFSTVEQVTADDDDLALDIYLYDRNRTSGERISRVSTGDADDGPGDADFSAMSADGRQIFFVSRDPLDGGTDAGSGPDLYTHAAGGETARVASLPSPADSDPRLSNSLTTRDDLNGSGSDAATPFAARRIKVSADGRVAAFSLASDLSLPAARGGTDADGVRDLFVWRQGSGLRRVRQGMGPAANSGAEPQLGCSGHADPGAPLNIPRCRAIADDGSLVFFESPDALVERDTNSYVDVYGLHTDSGAVELVSSPSQTPTYGGAGTQPHSAQYVDNSADGRHVFFATRDTLDPSRDLDGGRIDIYDARLGEVLPPLVSPPAPCGGESCQPPPSSPPEPSPVGSDVPVRSENANAGPRTTLVIGRVSAANRRRAARTGVISLAIRADAHGPVTAVATAKLNGRSRVVGRTMAQYRKPGRAIVLTLRLSATARQAFRADRRLSVRVRVRLAGAHPRTVTVSLLRPAR